VNTEIVVVNPRSPDPQTLARAAEYLRTGRLVAFPTETVYGLGANALDAAAVRGIFRAKGRPATNPLIVHIPDPSRVAIVAAEWPTAAARLAEHFWPGPLTIVVPKHPSVPEEVTAGGPTVAVRCPNHPVAQALLRAVDVPLAAPSANRSTELSPTRAEHVLKSLGGRIDLILDGGPCPGGIESTVVDVTGPMVRVLRPGLITVPMLEEGVGRVEVATKGEGIARSPGQMERHYSPRTPLRLVDGFAIVDDYLEAIAAGKRVGLLQLFGPEAMPNEPVAYAAKLYDQLHDLDKRGLDLILVEMPPDTPGWAAIRDRLTRASG